MAWILAALWLGLYVACVRSKRRAAGKRQRAARKANR